MKFLFGDFAAGFAEGASEQFAEKRKRNENLINAGIERAMTQGTELWKERNERAKVMADRSQTLRAMHPDLSSQEIAAMAGASENMYNRIVEISNIHSDLGLTFDPFGGDPQAVEAKVTAGNAMIDNVLTDPDLAGALTSGQVDRVAESFKSRLRTGFMQAGVTGATPDFLQSRVMKEAAALMPEVDDPEELQRLLRGEEDVISAPTLAELGFDLPPDPTLVQQYNINQQKLTASTAVPALSSSIMFSQVPNVNKKLAAETLFTIEGIDMAGNITFATGNQNTQRSIGTAVANNLTTLFQSLNMTTEGDKSNRQTLMSQRAQAAVSPLSTLAIVEYMDSVESRNTVDVTLQDLREAGATSEDINAYLDEFKDTTKQLDVNYTFFLEGAEIPTIEESAQGFVPESLKVGQLELSDANRMDAIKSLAVLRNLYKTEGGQRGTQAGSEGIFQEHMSLNKEALKGLRKYFEAIRDGNTGPRTRNEIVSFYGLIDAQIDIENPWRAMNTFYNPEGLPAAQPAAQPVSPAAQPVAAAMPEAAAVPEAAAETVPSEDKVLLEKLSNLTVGSPEYYRTLAAYRKLTGTTGRALMRN